MTSVPDRVVMAAHSLIASMRARPQMHSVWIETGVDDAGEFTYTLCCSLHPRAPSRLADGLPAEVDGIPVRVVPWPSSMRSDADVSVLDELRAQVAELQASAQAVNRGRA